MAISKSALFDLDYLGNLNVHTSQHVRRFKDLSFLYTIPLC